MIMTAIMVMSDNDSHSIVTVKMTSISITQLALSLLNYSTQFKTTLTTEMSPINITTNYITTATNSHKLK